MVIVMEMSSGRVLDEEIGCCGDEVWSAATAEVPRIEARLEEVASSTRCAPAKTGIEGFMACRYAGHE